MEAEKCPVCGAYVKKENLKGHYERVHPKRIGTLVQPQALAKPALFLRKHRRRKVLLLAVIVLALVGISVVVAQVIDASTMRMHIHPRISATIYEGPTLIPFPIPAQIGIDPNLWKDHSLDQYGMQGMSPLHTHDESGTVHVESNRVRDFTLREFLAVWGRSIDGSQVLGHPVESGHRAYILVDGFQRPATEDVVFADGQQIQTVCEPIR